ncbi:hypothetical protein BDR22DRAFT_870884 [Usnea florida]
MREGTQRKPTSPYLHSTHPTIKSLLPGNSAKIRTPSPNPHADPPVSAETHPTTIRDPKSTKYPTTSPRKRPYPKRSARTSSRAKRRAWITSAKKARQKQPARRSRRFLLHRWRVPSGRCTGAKRPWVRQGGSLGRTFNP